MRGRTPWSGFRINLGLFGMPSFSPFSSYLSAKGTSTRESSSLFSRPLGRPRRVLALVVIGMGLVTFFIPLIAINPPVLETTHWSAFRTVSRMYEGRLPEPVCERCGEPLVRSLLALPFEVTAAYLLLACALAALFFPESPKVLTAVGTIGSLLCLTWASQRIGPSKRHSTEHSST